ncbi:DUF4281 domain-containing protein [Aquipseudomonas alcaligenes]|uniref:DUF4281 domain-containing protein n=2 Tax=Aquipseudomonas alcaligenes TaxID=43263 RepID=A0A2V4ME62_AQUAC|nr:DUF4281 domain-containing protein [Pseudomonas alcaligenes]
MAAAAAAFRLQPNPHPREESPMPALSQKRLFQLASLAALGGWSVLILLPTWSHGPRLVLGVAVVLLCVLYGVSLFQALTSRGERSMGKPGFFSLRGVLALFSNPKAVLAAWIHILAFDLLAGLYIQQQGAAQGIGHLWLVPCYLLAMMFGPLGLLLFLAIGLLHGL